MQIDNKMNKKFVRYAPILAAAAMSKVQAADRPFTILALDGGGVRGLIPATVLKEMESISYQFVTDPANAELFEKPVPRDDNKKIVHMHTLFDMMSGTSTGSIITGMLTAPSDKPNTPKYTAQDVITLYSTRGNELFQSTAFPTWAAALIAIFSMILLGYLTFLLGKWLYDNPITYRNLKKAKKKLAAAKTVKSEMDQLGDDAQLDADGDGIPDILELVDDDSSDQEEKEQDPTREARAVFCCWHEKYIVEKMEKKEKKR